MSSKETLEPPCGNPYTILGLNYGATDADISKAYKKYALLYHPDKQKAKAKNKTLSEKEIEAITKKFHNITESKSFLLDSEYTEKRKKYDSYLKSSLYRQKEDEERDKLMNKKRKILRDELLKKEKQASTTTSTKSLKKSGNNNKNDIISNLQKQGARIREEYTNKKEKEEYINDIITKQNVKIKLEERQIKLKWRTSSTIASNNNLNYIDPLNIKESISMILKEFGSIASIELKESSSSSSKKKKKNINTAIVTFINASSCNTCVNHFSNNDSIRASYIGKNRHVQQQQKHHTSDNKSNSIDKESIQQRNMRQAAEREAIIRQMEEDDDGQGNIFNTTGSVKDSDRKSNTAAGSMCASSFPPKMPMDIGCTNPLEQLERYEMLYIPKEYRM